MEQTENTRQVDGILDGLLISLNDPKPTEEDDLLSLGSLSGQPSQPPLSASFAVAAPQPQPQRQPVPQQQQQQLQQPPPQQQQPQQIQPTELARLGDFTIYGRAKGNPKDPRQVALNLIFLGTGTTQLTDFKAEFQLQPGWQVNVQPADRNVLPPAGSGPISQTLYLFNMNNSPFQMHVKTAYKFGSQPLTENSVISALPPIQ
jgi:hypothetical protein